MVGHRRTAAIDGSFEVARLMEWIPCANHLSDGSVGEGARQEHGYLYVLPAGFEHSKHKLYQKQSELATSLDIIFPDAVATCAAKQYLERGCFSWQRLRLLV